ncbi:hypothetical protein HSBGL_2826 [Halapricum desulfuricans]|uniref:Uncharacterized protein n=1 Tax=Halapricum desulfuricans TaxID=2841257 RepID=A0A897NFL1_9EURY|nr:hypothetical protein HSBGL_2826 [Halapricum desulfuricans]
MSLGVFDRRGTADELRTGTETVTDPRQPTADETDVTAEDTAVLVNLVDHDEIQGLDELVHYSVDTA